MNQRNSLCFILISLFFALRSSFIGSNNRRRDDLRFEKKPHKNRKIGQRRLASATSSRSKKRIITLDEVGAVEKHANGVSAENGNRRRAVVCNISLWESTGVPGVGVATTPPPISTAYRGIMSVTSVRLPDSFHIARPRSPSVPLPIEVGLRQPSVSKRKCSFNARRPSFSSAPSIRGSFEGSPSPSFFRSILLEWRRSARSLSMEIEREKQSYTGKSFHWRGEVIGCVSFVERTQIAGSPLRIRYEDAATT